MKAQILVIIVTYNGIKWIDKCITSVNNSSVRLDCLVIDNGSTDGTQDYILSNFPNVRFFQSNSNLGFGQANNIGIRYAIEENYEYIYLLNQDALIFEDTISKLLSVFNKFPQYGILSPCQLQANMRHFDNNFLKGIIQSENSSEIIEDYYFKRLGDVYCVEDILAANWLVRRSCFITVGGFSPSFPHYGEDNNYCQRCLFHGFRIGVVPSAEAIHDTEERVVSMEKKIHQYHMLNISIISNIYNPKSFAILRTLLLSLRISFLYKSFKPIVNEIRLLLKLGMYKENNRISKNKGAFI